MVDRAVEEVIADALDRADYHAAASAAVRGYGPKVAGYLRAVLGSEQAAGEAFSIYCEFLWLGLPKFRREASFLTWSYQLAWGAVRRTAADPYRKRARRMATSEIEELAQEVYSTSVEKERAPPDRVAALRARLTPEEQTLLILRVDRDLGWRDIAEVLADEHGERASEAALRKRFERLRAKVRRMAEREGILPRS
jgi:RNA polymerase sigma-70 factor (ECF subfamily)